MFKVEELNILNLCKLINTNRKCWLELTAYVTECDNKHTI